MFHDKNHEIFAVCVNIAKTQWLQQEASFSPVDGYLGVKHSPSRQQQHPTTQAGYTAAVARKDALWNITGPLFDASGIGETQTQDMGVSIAMGIPKNGWFTRENPIKMDDLGYPYSRKPPYGDKRGVYLKIHLAKCGDRHG